jgi:hypothetical protein
VLEDVQTLNEWALQGRLAIYEDQLWRIAFAA